MKLITGITLHGEPVLANILMYSLPDFSLLIIILKMCIYLAASDLSGSMCNPCCGLWGFVSL